MAPNSWGQGREVGPLRLSISGGLRVVHGLPGVAVQRPGTGQNKSSITGEKQLCLTLASLSRGLVPGARIRHLPCMSPVCGADLAA